MVSEAADAQEALRLVRGQSFDLAILDMSLPDQAATDLIRDLKRGCANLRILVLSMFPERQCVVRVFQSGWNGCLRKNADPNEVIHAVRTILDGEEYVSEAVVRDAGRSQTTKLPHETLSGREYQVFQRLVAGKALTEIAEQLNLNVSTVSTYRARVLGKTNVRTNADLVRYAIHHNLVP